MVREAVCCEGCSFSVAAGFPPRSSGKCDEELAMHPAVKPVALVADAIRARSRRGGLIPDCFAGSGTTLKLATLVPSGLRQRAISGQLRSALP